MLNNHEYDDRINSAFRQLLAGPILPVETLFNADQIDLDIYDKIVVAFSGGKDSIASVLHLLDQGIEPGRIELWHHDVDGREGSNLMDWACVPDYCHKFAQAFDLELYFSWLQGGFEGELLKENSISQDHKIETPDGLLTLGRSGKPSTRQQFPQMSGDLATRWCSGALKIDLGRRAINNQDRFNNSRTLFITGERRQESKGRAKYNQFEAHCCDRRQGKLARRVDAWRPVLNWSENQVWDILEKYQVLAPVPYRLGWGRSSCMTCIFNGPKIWATIEHYFPERFDAIRSYEQKFGKTIARTKLDVGQVAAAVEPLEIEDLTALEQALNTEYQLPVLADQDHKWTLPVGAYSVHGCGAN